MPIDPKLSVSTFQNMDGSNFTTAGIETKILSGKGNLSTYTGVATNFNNNAISAIFDFKGSMPYGESNLSGSFRIRNNISDNSQTVQFRVQPTNINVPLNNNVSLYADPYVAMKVDYKTGDTTTNVGIFAGASAKVGKASVFVESQLYDVSKISSRTTGINAGISIPF